MDGAVTNGVTVVQTAKKPSPNAWQVKIVDFSRFPAPPRARLHFRDARRDTYHPRVPAGPGVAQEVHPHRPVRLSHQNQTRVPAQEEAQAAEPPLAPDGGRQSWLGWARRAGEQIPYEEAATDLQCVCTRMCALCAVPCPVCAFFPSPNVCHQSRLSAASPNCVPNGSTNVPEAVTN